MCKICRQNCCGVRFDFHCKKFYHDYCESAVYAKPDLVCFFNPALHRPGFRGFDTWPQTIECALKTCAPILITSTTENENFLDLRRVEKLARNDIKIILPPMKNYYASTRPERNFASDDDVPIMFKNNYLFVVSKALDLIQF
jgi:mitochondrial splicing suppressor protein 51